MAAEPPFDCTKLPKGRLLLPCFCGLGFEIDEVPGVWRL